MKTLRLLFTFRIVAGFASLSFGQTIVGSAHDFSDGTGYLADAWNVSNEICITCHAPHNNLNAEGELLWNHTLSADGIYTPYDSPTMDAIPVFKALKKG